MESIDFFTEDEAYKILNSNLNYIDRYLRKSKNYKGYDYSIKSLQTLADILDISKNILVDELNNNFHIYEKLGVKLEKDNFYNLSFRAIVKLFIIFSFLDDKGEILNKNKKETELINSAIVKMQTRKEELNNELKQILSFLDLYDSLLLQSKEVLKKND